MRYKSFYGSATINQAIKMVGIDHALHATTVDNWSDVVSAHILDTWSRRLVEEHIGWCAIMQAGPVETQNALYS